MTPYLSINPQGLVPAMVLENGEVLTQSMAIIEYLDAIALEPALLSDDKIIAAKQRALASVIGNEIQPLNNLKVLQYLQHNLSVDKVKEKQWYHHWIIEGFDYLENEVIATPYAMGDTLSIVDVFLIPQIYNAIRFKLDINRWPKLAHIYQACNQLSAFSEAAPEKHL
jgi:maleylpyruvate isomerase